MKKNDDKQTENQVNADEVPASPPATSQTDDWKNKYLRALADYQNLEKRVWAEKEEIRRYAAEIVLGKLLPVFDTFIIAQIHLQDDGLALALKELVVRLSELGVEKMEVAGKQFDPHEMECVEVVVGEDGKVVSEVASGYRLHGRVLRAAKVKVGQKKV